MATVDISFNVQKRGPEFFVTRNSPELIGHKEWGPFASAALANAEGVIRKDEAIASAESSQGAPVHFNPFEE